MARLLIVEDNYELAALMVSAAGSRGHWAKPVHNVRAALEALAQEQFALAIVDLVLPDRPAKDVLLQLKLRSIPALVMSGVFRGDRYAHEATHLHGAAGFFEKPFQMGALLDTVERLVGVGAVRSPEDEAETLPELFGGAPHPVEPRAEPEELEELLPLEEPEGAPEGAGSQDVAAEPPSHHAPFGDRAKVWKGADAPMQAAGWTRAGSLSRRAVPRLLNAYYQARHSGELKLRQGKVVKVIFFEAGRPIYAASNLLQERFGQFCVRQGALAAGDLPAVLELAKASNLRTAVSMVRLGLLTETQRVSLLEMQVREIIASTFAWSEGAYQLVSGPLKRSDLVKLSLFPGNLILEGAQRGQSLIALREQMPSTRRLFPVEAPPYALYELTLSGAQAQLMVHSDGSKTVEDLLTLTELSEREALGTLLGLEWAGALEERPDERSSRRITFGL